MPSLDDALISLRRHFGFDSFREGQGEVIAAILSGNEALVVMPTGSGKSLCYQLPALMLEGATIVVSPLIALMKDQVDALQARGLPATFINSSIDLREQGERINGLRQSRFKIVYIAPERFRSGRFVEALRSIRISLFAIDEAHCISTWGHDFRPDYLRLKQARRALGNVQTLALTATATPYVRSDIIEQLALLKPQTFVSGFDRPNLSIDVIHTATEHEKILHIKRLANSSQGSGIIYASTRKSVEQASQELRRSGLSVAAYHAGMKDAERARAQEQFMSGGAQMIVATNAFGMGIDKPDIRFVAHYQMPGSIEAYYQEIGRAGRDGLPSTCVLLFNYADKNTHDFFIEGSYPDGETIRDIYEALIHTGLKRIELSTREIGSRAGVKNELAVQSVLYLLERAGHIERVTLSADQRIANGDQNRGRRHRSILLLDDGSTTLRVNPNDVARRGALEKRKLREMLNFCYSDRCFRAYILDYFGDRHHARRCGTCGNCNPGSPTRIPLPRSDLNEIEYSRRGQRQRANAKQESYWTDLPRGLTADETLRVRKILACAARMKGRFGKHILAGTLRGSKAKNIQQARLNSLSTYGLLQDMTQDEILAYVDALVAARCLKLSPGEYPTVSMTEFGGEVMRERERVELALIKSVEKTERSSRERSSTSETVSETFGLYREGLTVEEIAAKRGVTVRTIENHLADCIQQGLQVDISQFVSAVDRELIEKAISAHGTESLRAIRDAVPASISYGMIRFVIADQLKRS